MLWIFNKLQFFHCYLLALLPSTGIETTTKYHHASMDKGGTVSVLSTTYPYHSPVNPTGVSGFQPKGGAFITMPISPKVMKPEPVKSEQQQYSTQYSVNNLVSSVHTENGRNIPKFTSAPVLHTVNTFWRIDRYFFFAYYHPDETLSSLINPLNPLTLENSGDIQTRDKFRIEIYLPFRSFHVEGKKKRINFHG